MYTRNVFQAPDEVKVPIGYCEHKSIETLYVTKENSSSISIFSCIWIVKIDLNKLSNSFWLSNSHWEILFYFISTISLNILIFEINYWLNMYLPICLTLKSKVQYSWNLNQFLMAYFIVKQELDVLGHQGVIKYNMTAEF